MVPWRRKRLPWLLLRFSRLSRHAMTRVSCMVRCPTSIIRQFHDRSMLHLCFPLTLPSSLGDVKPANFCLKDKMRNPFFNRTTSYLKAIDFGCSQLLTGESMIPSGDLVLIYGTQSGVTRICDLIKSFMLQASNSPSSSHLGYAASRRFTKRTGTPVFMSPEIFARDYAEKADIWSIGVMLYW